jgi:hypothetical protein
MVKTAGTAVGNSSAELVRGKVVLLTMFNKQNWSSSCCCCCGGGGGGAHHVAHMHK